MAVAAGVLTESRRRTLEAVCDTFVPAIEREDDPGGLYGRAASDLGVAGQIEGMMAQAMVPEEIAGFGELLDALAERDFASQPLEVREQLLHGTAASGPEAKLGIHSFKHLSLLLFYALPDEQGRNPNWEAIGFPGAASAPPSPEQAPKTIPLTEVSGEAAVLEADVVVVGSGAGGGVVAAELQRAGKSVLVLEQGGYRNEADFKQLELVAMQELYLGGGLAASESGSIGVFAGSTLGGGTVVNYMNCLRTTDPVRAEWAAHGIEGIDGDDYDRHMDAIWERLAVNDEATSQNRTHQRLIEGLDKLGLAHKPITRNADVSCDDPRICGYCSGGCQKGCKQSTLKTYLQDAADAGSRFVVGCRAERILVDDGRASGVEATVTHADGTTTALTVHAPTVVAACGSVETPALLLRSGVGGPAVGKHLRLHPAGVVQGIYPDPVEGWLGQIQSEVSDAFAGIEGDHGFLIEAVGVGAGVFGMSLPWESGLQHKDDMSRLAHHAPFISVQRDHGSGEVAIDAYGRAVVRWDFDDELDRRIFIRAQQELARLHEAASADEILTFHSRRTAWRRGEDIEAFIASLADADYGPNEIALFTAHQMGAARMGSDPASSVADGRGQLHDTEGVWIGDASAFPTAPGVNPMITIMSLARRTAHAIADAG